MVKSSFQRRDVLTTLALLAVLSVVVAIEYSFTYALIVISVILAMGVEVWLFLATLMALDDLRRRRLAVPQLRLIAILCLAAAALHLVSPAPLSTATKFAAVIAAVVFVAMTVFGLRK